MLTAMQRLRTWPEWLDLFPIPAGAWYTVEAAAVLKQLTIRCISEQVLDTSVVREILNNFGCRYHGHPVSTA